MNPPLSNPQRTKPSPSAASKPTTLPGSSRPSARFAAASQVIVARVAKRSSRPWLLASLMILTALVLFGAILLHARPSAQAAGLSVNESPARSLAGRLPASPPSAH